MALAPVSSLARLYQQRVPTGPVATYRERIPTGPTSIAGIYQQRVVPPQRWGSGPSYGAMQRAQELRYKQAGQRAGEQEKVGPRGTTAADVAKVAQFGLPALPRTIVPNIAAPQYNLPAGAEKAVSASVIGEPGPGYGEKYGGFSTMSQLQDAVLGEALGAYEMADLARQQAEAARTSYYNDMTGRVAERLAPIASLAGVRPGATLSEQDRARLATGYRGVQEFGATPEYQAAREIEAQNQNDFGLFGQPQMNANQMMRAAYEAMLKGGAQSPEDRAMLEQRAVGELGWFPEETALYNQRAATDPYVSGPEQIASVLESTPLSQYAQQIAVQRYGLDPNLAAGVFGQEIDTEYAKKQQDALMQQMGGTSVGQFILNNYGPEEYQRWMQQKADEALYGTEKEQQTYLDEIQAEQNRQNDQVIANTYGFYPEEIQGIPADDVRSRMGNEAFQKILKDALDNVDKGEFSDVVAEAAFNSWLSQTNDRVGARLLQEIIAKFTTD